MLGSRARALLLTLPASLLGCRGPGLWEPQGTGVPELRILSRTAEQPAEVRATAPDATAPRVSDADRRRFTEDDQRANQAVAQALLDGGRRGLETLPAGDTPVQRLARGKALLRLDQPAEAAVFFDGLLRDDPDYLPARAGKAAVFLLQHKADEAIQVLTRVTALWPENLDARVLLARALDRAQRTDEAIEVLRSLVPAGALADRAAWLLGHILWDRQQHQEALDVLAATIDNHPEAMDLRFLYGSMLEERGRFEAARDQFARALTGRAPPPHARVRLIHTLRALGNFAEADQQCRKLAEDHTAAGQVGAQTLSAQELSKLCADVAEELRTGERRGYTLPELRGILASSTDRMRRLEALRILTGGDIRAVTKDLKVLLQDADPVLRIHALRYLAAKVGIDADSLRRVLADSDAMVRTEAVSIVARLPEARALPVLLATLRAEQDPATFRALHEALEKKSGQRLFLETGAERSPERRAELVAEWGRRLQ